ncbi:hypothetical protein Lbir_0913 [Legionella birminghamensis]|uniref:Dot/Icm T4SS effector n=1 Tax=Legionella birminghamensis TaxID=28083 RepID=A0A378ICS3_9GAMM|nr:hypothetical protein [Legionella birminghamensis]KTC74327.1 hypothetical protein Lbir_0913 [Legionella birminghamensis]STX32555.1 Uncharacterised protein [Legionella birminghamensis]
MAFEVPAWEKIKEAYKEQRRVVITKNQKNRIEDLSDDRFGQLKFLDILEATLDSPLSGLSDKQKANIFVGSLLVVEQMIEARYWATSPDNSALHRGIPLIINRNDSNKMDPLTGWTIFTDTLDYMDKQIHVDNDPGKPKLRNHLFSNIRKDEKASLAFDHDKYMTVLVSSQKTARLEKDDKESQDIKEAEAAEKKAKLEEEKRIKQEAEKAKGHSGGVLSTLKHMVWSSTPAPTSTTDEKFTPAEPQGPS